VIRFLQAENVEVYEQCPEVSRALVYQIVTEHLQYRKIGAGWVPWTS
jgi:hypothetical protein